MTKYTYQVTGDGLNKVILRSDGACIPMDESNSDYRAYLRHLAGGDDEAQSL